MARARSNRWRRAQTGPPSRPAWKSWRLAKRFGAGLVLNTDAHLYTDLIDLAFARVVALGAGLDDEDFQQMRQRAMDLINRIGPPWA
jgi:histidinol phosphatase-like PHP family hydrolase